MRDADLVVMGFVRGAFGVRGWVKVQADTQYADSLFDYPQWWLKKDGEWKPYTFTDGSAQPKGLVVKFDGVDDREIAAGMRGMQIAIARDQLPAAADDEYYWIDLIGLDVVNKEDIVLGKVAELMETGANDVLVVRGDTDERLIPFVSDYIVDVDLAAKRITVDWGLDY
ncbi:MULTISPECIES: ribosome maturation factor RimM [Vogesella]|jgi:16S rRNA processing protein RimM|uniref:Ribosome maturation factor RimM n=1 Tax=Vogesella aquatica TaxID=2984206 RepID=A0ABT5IWR5_9NEIS|nr:MULTISPECIES: ribosome maturation factor RimM [Vogesella]MBP7580141.1 ribosome maturation factor RimM [Vogesella sp.]MDC7716981.1 ribosome maturation factor RimM [Vogesella aquatica]UDM16738.1 ribosome maturation factor RimM [Vogesella sp. XCS3]